MIQYKNAKVILADRIINGSVFVSEGKIVYVGENESAFKADETIDCEECYLAPGFVEIHTHGAGGADFMDGTVSAYETACLTHLAHGTTTILPTALSATKNEILRSIDAFKKAREVLRDRGPELYGLHIEGPYLSPRQAGAMVPEFIRAPQEDEYEEILSAGKDCIKRWTFAIEYPESKRFAERLLEEGILPSVGHCDAEYSEVLNAFHNGVTHVTHLFSCMSTIKRVGGFRHSGVLESAFCIPGMTVEIIADGCHIPPELLELTYRVKGPERTALTCDSMRCAGQDVKESFLGSFENGTPVIIEDGVAKLTDRSAFAGSIATDDRLVRVMLSQAGVPLEHAVQMMSLTPAKILGIDSRKGSIAEGKDADLIIFDEEINVKRVYVKGKLLWKS